MNHLLRPRIWPSFLASSGVPSTGSGQAHPATYRSGTPQNQPPAVTRWPAHLHGLAKTIHETSALSLTSLCRFLAKQKQKPQRSQSTQRKYFYLGQLCGLCVLCGTSMAAPVVMSACYLLLLRFVVEPRSRPPECPVILLQEQFRALA